MAEACIICSRTSREGEITRPRCSFVQPAHGGRGVGGMQQISIEGLIGTSRVLYIEDDPALNYMVSATDNYDNIVFAQMARRLPHCSKH